MKLLIVPLSQYTEYTPLDLTPRMKRLMTCGFAFDRPITAGIEFGLNVPYTATDDGSTIPGYTHELSVPEMDDGVTTRPYG